MTLSLPQSTPLERRADPQFLRFGNAGANAKIRLFCLAHAGSTASIFAPWARALAPNIEIVAVELPGHGIRMDEQPLTDVQAIVDDLIEPITALQGDGRPFAFYGHSFGAIVALECALLLQETLLAGTNAGPAGTSHFAPDLRHLFAGASRAPHLRPVLPALSHLEEDDFLYGVQQRYGGISEAVLAEPELLEMMLPPMRADFAAYESYLHQGAKKLTCPITAFSGKLDPVVTEEAVAEWADHTTASFRLHTLPGDHFFLVQQREQLLGLIRQALLSGSDTPARQETQMAAG